jgi:hypothetical protein
VFLASELEGGSQMNDCSCDCVRPQTDRRFRITIHAPESAETSFSQKAIEGGYRA